MKKKLKLAFEQLENEMTLLDAINQKELKGGIQRDANGNIIFVPMGSGVVEHPSGSTALLLMGYIYADDGTPIQAYKNLSGDAGWDTDCHGMTFADGEYWINDDQVKMLLSGDNYISVPSGSYASGNVVVYYNSAGQIVHSATISTVSGNVVTVYGQGGLQVENDINTLPSGFPSYSYYRVYG